MNSLDTKLLYVTITRAKFEELSQDLLDRCKKPVEQALSDAGISKSEQGRQFDHSGAAGHDEDFWRYDFGQPEGHDGHDGKAPQGYI